MASCFLFTSNSYAINVNLIYQGEASGFCLTRNAGNACAHSTNFTSACPSADINTAHYFASNDGSHICYQRNSTFWNPATIEPSDYDSDNCFTPDYGPAVCPDNPDWIDADGYGTDGCTDTLCPGDSGWVDAEGYDVNGFDSNGQDRGGNTSAQGGGYFGSAGSGGEIPSYISPPVPNDPQNGDNRDANNILQCNFAYPVTVTKSLLPSSVQDGLAGCSNECVYQPTATIWDFNNSQEVVELSPTGFACSTEPAISVVDIVTYTAPPSGQEPPELYDNLNACYLTNGGYFLCDHPLDPDEPDCYQNNNGWISLKFQCPSDSTNTLGTYNGVTQYIDPFSNCESFGGTIMCVDTNGNFIPLDDPDHVINGGNGDGNSNNDVFTNSADVAANGQTTQERIVQALDARELAREIDNRLADNFAAISLDTAVIEQLLGDIDGTISQGSEGAAELDLDGLTDIIGQVGTNPDYSFDGSVLDGLTNTVGGSVFNGGACRSLAIDIYPAKGLTFNLDTCKVDTVRSILEYFLYISTLITVYFIILGRKEDSA